MALRDVALILSIVPQTVRHHNKMTLLHQNRLFYVIFVRINKPVHWPFKCIFVLTTMCRIFPQPWLGKLQLIFGHKPQKCLSQQLMQDVTVFLSDRIREDQQRQYAESSVTHRMITSGCDCVVIRHYTRGQQWTCVLQPRSFSYYTFWLDQAKK